MTGKGIKILTEACRIVLGITFIFSGIVKGIDPVGNAIKIEDYLGAFGLSAFNGLALFISINMIAIEFVLGVCMLAAVYRKVITTCMLIFMSFMTLLSLYLAIFNPVHDCGCFGDAFILTNWQTFFKNMLILLPAAIVTFFYRKRMTPIYTGKTHWFVSLFAYLYIVAFAFWNYRHLPIMDFRPYKIGTNIPEAMSMPEDATQNEYEYIYEKNGIKKAFSLEELSEADSTWTYVDAKLVKEGYVPPIASFKLENSEGNDISDAILNDSKGVFLLITPRLEKASDEHIDEINDIFDYSEEQGMKFYCLTSSSAEGIQAWRDNTGAEYPFLTADDVTLKTVIRSNPGLILLKSGTILMKWHHNDIPTEETLNTTVNTILETPTKTEDKEKRFWIWAIVCFSLPLLLGWIYDYLRNRVNWKKEGTNNI